MASRFEHNLPEFLPAIKDMRIVVPKLHIEGHKVDCKYRYSLSYTDGVGQCDGEGVERPWDIMKDASRTSKEMNAGARHEALDDICDDWNYLKTLKIGECLQIVRCQNQTVSSGTFVQ